MAGASISMPGFPAGVSGVMSEPHSPAPTVFVLDDDISFGQALRRLLASVGLNAEVFDSAAALLRRGPVVHVSCLLLDVRLPGMCGLDLQAELKRARFNMPITVRAMKAGAIDFLAKPFRDQDMLDAIALALGRDRARHEAENIQGKLRGSYHYLTRRERQVMALVTSGMTNKSVAETLSVSEITVKVHRGNVMKKMGAKSLADLIRMADALAIDGAWLASVQEMGELQC